MDSKPSFVLGGFQILPIKEKKKLHEVTDILHTLWPYGQIFVTLGSNIVGFNCRMIEEVSYKISGKKRKKS